MRGADPELWSRGPETKDKKWDNANSNFSPFQQHFDYTRKQPVPLSTATFPSVQVIVTIRHLPTEMTAVSEKHDYILSCCCFCRIPLFKTCFRLSFRMGRCLVPFYQGRSTNKPREFWEITKPWYGFLMADIKSAQVQSKSCTEDENKSDSRISAKIGHVGFCRCQCRNTSRHYHPRNDTNFACQMPPSKARLFWTLLIKRSVICIWQAPSATPKERRKSMKKGPASRTDTRIRLSIKLLFAFCMITLFSMGTITPKKKNWNARNRF